MTLDHISAGGVVIDRAERKVLLLHRNISDRWGYDSWHLPKGTQLPDEGLDQTALREVAEETGYEVKIIEYLGVLPSTYERLGQLVNKLTHYFLMEAVSRPSQHDTEHDEVDWVDFDLAGERLSEFPIWEKEAEILEVAIAKL